jgi:hypothetical protein
MMDLIISRYCSITPGEISIDGKVVATVEHHDSLEKSLVQSYRELGMEYPKFFKMDNLSKLSLLAAECVLKTSDMYGLTDNGDVAVVLCNASSSLVTDVNYQHTIDDTENYFPSPSLFVYTLPNISIGEICIKYKIYGENMFLVSEKFDIQALYFYVSRLLESTGTNHCLAGWVECNQAWYRGFVMLVEKDGRGEVFTPQNIQVLYQMPVAEK